MKEIWNIIIISSKDKDYVSEYEHLMNDISSVEKHENIRFIIYEYDEEKTAAGTKIFIFEFDNKKKEIEGFTFGDLYKKEDLINFFKTLVVKENNAGETNRYIIITWGHGAGMGVFAKIETLPKHIPLKDGSEWQLMKNEEFEIISEKVGDSLLEQSFLNANNLLPEIDLSVITTPLFHKINFAFSNEIETETIKELKGFKHDFLNNVRRKIKMLTGNDLNTIFAESFPENIKVDILITVNCYTQCFEFGNCIKDKVTMLVAPQTMIPFEGINYKQLFLFIVQTHEPSLEKIARNISTSFLPKYESVELSRVFATKYASFPFSETCFSCNRLDNYDEIETILGTVGYLLNELKKKDLVFEKTIKYARNKCEDTTAGRDYGLIDFTFFYQNIIEGINAKECNNQDESIQDCIKKLNKLYLHFIEKTRRKSCLAMSMSQAEAYIQFDGNIEDGHFINITSRSPYFLSVFFPNATKTTMARLLSPTVNLAARNNINQHFNYSDWKNFVTTLFA